MVKRLQDQVAVVTGASSGNGRAIALALAAEGASVVVSDIREEALAGGYESDINVPTRTAIELAGGRADYHAADASKAKDVEALVARAVSKFGRLDIMVNNAGVFAGLHDITNETEEQYDFTMAVNAKGVWLGSKYAITQMLKQTPRAKAFLHRFAVAGAAIRYRAMHRDTVEDIVALDVALRCNDAEWEEHPTT